MNKKTSLTIETPTQIAGGYYPSPWSCEDGGPTRQQAVTSVKGPKIQRRESLHLQASRRICTGNMMVLRDPGEVYLMHVDTLRDRIGMSCSSHVEKLDPKTLKTVKRSKPLPGGRWWPGGICVHRNGDLYVSFGRYVHRLDADCNLKSSYHLPQDLPYNSHMVLDNGYLITKPISDTETSWMLVIDPETMQEACTRIELPEPSISRLSAQGNTVYVTGVTTIYRYHFHDETGELELDTQWSLDYVGQSTQEYGWDPVIDENNIWFIDNGKHRMGGSAISMLNAGISATPNRLIRVSTHDSSDYSMTPICNRSHGSVTNPPLYCPQRNIVVAYDSSNSVIQAWRHDRKTQALTELWTRNDFSIGGHTIYYPDSGEIFTTDYQSLKSLKALREGENSVVLDIETGLEKSRVALRQYTQSCCFPAPGFGRDIYWLGLDKLTYLTIK
ncbi:MAG: hypothetical protein ACRBBW_06890 [Cellvibrionaceae bacterium]